MRRSPILVSLLCSLLALLVEGVGDARAECWRFHWTRREFLKPEWGSRVLEFEGWKNFESEEECSRAAAEYSGTEYPEMHYARIERRAGPCEPCSQSGASRPSAPPGGSSSPPATSPAWGRPFTQGRDLSKLKGRDIAAVVGVVAAARLLESLPSKPRADARPRTAGEMFNMRPERTRPSPEARASAPQAADARPTADLLERGDREAMPGGSWLRDATKHGVRDMTEGGRRLAEAPEVLGWYETVAPSDLGAEVPEKTRALMTHAGKILEVIGLVGELALSEDGTVEQVQAASETWGAVFGQLVPSHASLGDFVSGYPVAVAGLSGAALENATRLIDGEAPNTGAMALGVAAFLGEYVPLGSTLAAGISERSLTWSQLRSRHGVVEGTRRAFVYELMGN